MTQGDVLAFALIVLATGITAWAGMLLCAFLFSERTRRAAQAISARPGRSFLIGLLAALGGIGIGFAMMVGAAGPIKALGVVLMGATLSVSVLGNAGLASILADRIAPSAPDKTGFALVARSTGLLTASSFIPLVGWFFLFPLQIILGLGAGLAALRGRATAPQAQAQGYEL